MSFIAAVLTGHVEEGFLLVWIALARALTSPGVSANYPYHPLLAAVVSIYDDVSAGLQ